MLLAAQGGDRVARERLVTSSLGLVRSIASYHRDLGLPLDDLAQEGAVGLLDAIDHYDADRGASFETYARFRIRRAIRNALTDKGRLIRLPKHIVERRRAIDRAEAGLAAAAAGRTPTAAELAAATGLSVDAVLEARAASVATLSLDEPVLPDGSPLSGVVADPRAADPELIALEHERTRLLTAAVAGLPERQRRVVTCRWGLCDAPVSNDALAARFELSPRRAQTIGRDALYGLRRALDPAGGPQTPSPANPRAHRT